jgi:hypothetical protein
LAALVGLRATEAPTVELIRTFFMALLAFFEAEGVCSWE